MSDLAGELRSHEFLSLSGTLSAWKPSLRRLLREPLLHFFVIGLFLFIAAEWHRNATDAHRIVVDRAKVEKLALDYRLQYGAWPTHSALEALVNRYIDDEVLFREGEALGLGIGDEIVRRRVVQKMQFVDENAHAPAEPTEAELMTFYRSHAERYRLPERRSFTHIYFSPDHGGEFAAHARALVALASLKSADLRAPERGDAFPDLYDYSGFGPNEASRLFGHSEFAAALFAAPVGRWSGPYRSGYGIHLLRVQSVEPAQLPPFASVRVRVRADYLNDVEEKSDASALAALESKYTIVRSDGLGPP